MIEIDAARPWPLPPFAGVSIRAAAHRISVEVGAEHQPTRAVWVPARHTDSRVAVIAGGRLFPGVHATADVTIDENNDSLTWSVTSAARPSGTFDIEARASLDRIDNTTSEVADIVIGTALGLSPGRRPDQIETVEMNPRNRRYSVVELIELKSDFMSGFSSAVPAEALLMNDVDVTWHPMKMATKRFT